MAMQLPSLPFVTQHQAVHTAQSEFEQRALTLMAETIGQSLRDQLALKGKVFSDAEWAHMSGLPVVHAPSMSMGAGGVVPRAPSSTGRSGAPKPTCPFILTSRSERAGEACGKPAKIGETFCSSHSKSKGGKAGAATVLPGAAPTVFPGLPPVPGFRPAALPPPPPVAKKEEEESEFVSYPGVKDAYLHRSLKIVVVQRPSGDNVCIGQHDETTGKLVPVSAEIRATLANSNITFEDRTSTN